MRTLFSACSVPLFRVLDLVWNGKVYVCKINIILNGFNVFDHDGLAVNPIDTLKREFQLADLTPIRKKYLVLHIAVQRIVFDKDNLGQQTCFRVDG